MAGAADGEDDVLVAGMGVDDEVVVGALLVEARLVSDPRENTAGEELVEEWPEMLFVLGAQLAIDLQRIGQWLSAGVFSGFDRDPVECGKAVKVPLVELRDPAGELLGIKFPRAASTSYQKRTLRVGCTETPADASNRLA